MLSVCSCHIIGCQKTNLATSKLAWKPLLFQCYLCFSIFILQRPIMRGIYHKLSCETSGSYFFNCQPTLWTSYGFYNTFHALCLFNLFSVTSSEFRSKIQHHFTCKILNETQENPDRYFDPGILMLCKDTNLLISLKNLKIHQHQPEHTYPLCLTIVIKHTHTQTWICS